MMHTPPLPFGDWSQATAIFPADRARAVSERLAQEQRCPRCEARPGEFCAAPTGLPASGPHPERWGGDAR